MMMIDVENALNYLNELYPDVRCALNYEKDYELLIAVMLSAQTTDKSVNAVTKKLFFKYPTLEDLSKASYDDVYEIVKSLGLASRKAKNIILIAESLVKNGYDHIPNDAHLLMSLAGVGNKTKNVVLAELYDEPLLAIDTHVHRISKRWGIISKEQNFEINEKKLTKLIGDRSAKQINHQMIEFGRNICKAISPLCKECKLNDICPKKSIH